MATINPFQAPINYAVDVQSPFEAALGGFKIGAATAEVEAARAARERAQTAQTELTNLFKNPNATSADYTRVAAFLPKDQASMVLQGFEAQTKERQQNTLQLGTQVYTAIKSGNPALAQRILQDQADALRNSDREKDAQGYDDLSNLIRLNPTNAQAIIGLNIASLPGGKDFLDSADKALATIRTEAQAPSALTKAKADADKAVADAEQAVAVAKDTPSRLVAEAALKEAQTAQQEALTQASVGGERRAAAEAADKLRKAVADADAAVSAAITAQATATNAEEKAKADAAKAKADAEKARIEAQYAEGVAKDAIKKRAADLGLTTAQTNQALATTRKLGVETSKAALELEALKATGGIDPEKKFAQEEKIRKEWQGRSKMYGELQGTFSTLKASADSANGPGDIALITGFMKMLDPGSVVRETEFATARDTAGLFMQLQNRLQKAQNGQLLSPEQRKEYVALSQKYLDAAQTRAAQERKDLGIVVKNYNLNPQNVFGAETAPAQPAALPASATVGGKTYPRPASFTDAQWRDYLKANGVIQ
jgi:hypothetical protein